MAELYLHLFHGRDAKDSDMDGWGFNGPTIGPVEYVHGTYGCDIKFALPRAETAIMFPEEIERDNEFRARHANAVVRDEFDIFLPVDDGLVVYDGKFYGDWSVSAHQAKGLYSIDGMSTFEATYHEAISMLEPGEKLICCSGDGRPVVAVGQ